MQIPPAPAPMIATLGAASGGASLSVARDIPYPTLSRQCSYPTGSNGR